MVQVADVKRTWTEHHPDNPGQYAIAVLNTARIMGAFLDGVYTVGSEYTLLGVFTGHEFPFAVQNAGFWDGATDGTHNYSVDYNNGGVYRFDTFWGSPVKIFNTATHYLGITFDRSNNTFWLSRWDDGVIEHRSLNGQLLSSFSTALIKPGCLALDPADGTLWMGSQGNLGTFYRFKQDGTLLGTRTYPQLASLNTLGGEFQSTGANPPGPTPTPTPTPPGGAVVSVSAAPSSVKEGKNATFTIQSSFPPPLPLTVNFSMSGKAKSGSDYTLNPAANHATIPAGSTSTTVLMHTNVDQAKEKTEPATMTLQNGDGYTVSSTQNKATVNIKNKR